MALNFRRGPAEDGSVSLILKGLGMSFESDGVAVTNGLLGNVGAPEN